MLLACSMSTWARDLQIEIPQYHSVDTLTPENMDLPIYNTCLSNHGGFHINGVFELLALNPRHEMYAVFCFEKADTIFLRITGVGLNTFDRYIKGHVAGVHILEGWRKIPFFLLSTPFDPQAQAMGMFSRSDEMATIKWVRTKVPDDVYMAIDGDFTSFTYYYEDKRWHAKSLFFNGTNVLNF